MFTETNKITGKIKWTTENSITAGGRSVACASALTPGYNQGAGVKRNSKLKLILKQLAWPFYKIHNDLLVDGFIEYEIGKLIKKYIKEDTVFLEIGCGDMCLRRFVPKNRVYNALDLELSEFHIRRVAKDNRVNVVLASATDIPAPSNIATLLVSTETFEHIPDINKAIEEVYRVACPGAILICSIPNNSCFKYQCKGPHPGHVNNWSFEGFVDFMRYHHFELMEGFMKGRWVSLPSWLTKISYHLPLTSKSEFYNTNFFYVFKIEK